MNNFLDQFKVFFGKINSLGIPVPVLRDPRTGLGSVSLTLLIISFVVVLAGLVGKITNLIGNVDLTNGLWLFGICTSLYFGRGFQNKGMTIDNSTDKEVK